MPQTRDMEFHPSALEKGIRSERAPKLAIAEMYVQGVSTRKVTEVMQQLCGLDVSSTQGSRATQILDEELTAWRRRQMSGCPMGRLFEVCLTAGAILGDARGKQAWQGLDRGSIGGMQHFSRPIPARPVSRCTFSCFLADSSRFSLAPQDRNAYKEIFLFWPQIRESSAYKVEFPPAVPKRSNLRQGDS